MKCCCCFFPRYFLFNWFDSRLKKQYQVTKIYFTALLYIRLYYTELHYTLLLYTILAHDQFAVIDLLCSHSINPEWHRIRNSGGTGMTHHSLIGPFLHGCADNTQVAGRQERPAGSISARVTLAFTEVWCPVSPRHEGPSRTLREKSKPLRHSHCKWNWIKIDRTLNGADGGRLRTRTL